MKPYLLVIIATLLALTTQAQTYQERQAQNNEYRRLQDATRRAFAVPDRPYSGGGYKPSGSSSSVGPSRANSKGGVVSSNAASRAEAEELAAKWKATWDALKRSPPPTAEDIKFREEARRRQEANAVIYKKISDAYHEKMMAEIRAEKALRAPYVDKFYKAGFTPGEAEDITRDFLMDYNANLKPNHQQILDLIPLLNATKTNLFTLPYATFKDAISLLYFYAPFTTATLIDDVRSKFADKTDDLDNIEVNCIIAFYKNTDYTKDKENCDLMWERYQKILKKYPDIDTYVVQQTNDSDPYKTKIYTANYYGKKDSKYRKQYNAVQAKILKTYEAASASAAGVEAILQENHFLHLCDVISKPFLDGMYTTKLDFCNLDGYPQWGPQNGLVGKTEHMRCTPQVLQQLSENGNLEAQYAYSLYLATSTDETLKKKHREQLVKNANAGDMNSLLLMFYAPLWEFSFNDALIRNKVNSYTHADWVAALGKNFKYRDAVLVELKAAVAKSNIPKANLLSLGWSLFNDYNKYPYLEGFRAYGEFLKEANK